MVSTWKSVGVSGFPIVIVSARFAPAPTVLLLAGAAAVVIITSETKIANDWSVERHRMSIHDFPSLRLPPSRPAWPCAAPCPSHCIGSPSEALGRRPYNLYAIRRRWKKVWVSTDPLPQKPTRPISIYSPNPTSIYLSFWRKRSRSPYHKIIQLVSQHAQRTFTQIKYTVYPPGN